MNKIKRIYYAHPMSIYNSPQERRDILLLEQLGFEVVNPTDYQRQYNAEKIHFANTMDFWISLVNVCDALAYRSFPDNKIGAGIFQEICAAEELDLPIIELPTITSKRILSVTDTKKYLMYSGKR